VARKEWLLISGDILNFSTSKNCLRANSRSSGILIELWTILIGNEHWALFDGARTSYRALVTAECSLLVTTCSRYGEDGVNSERRAFGRHTAPAHTVNSHGSQHRNRTFANGEGH
jgi:hypothetical protein